MKVWQICLVSALQLSACNALVGIEDLQVKPDAGATGAEPKNQQLDAGPSASSGGKGGSGGEAVGRPDSGGRSGSVGSAGASAGHTAAESGGSSAPSAGVGGAAAAAGSSAASGGAGGAGGAGGSTQTLPGGTVSGVVLDYRNHVLPDIVVRVGDKQTTTDTAGRFSFEAAPATYDVTLQINTTVRNLPTTFVWQFQGLTRRDPTLQVYRGARERFGEIVIKTNNVTFPVESSQKAAMFFSSPDGDFDVDLSSNEVDYLSPQWVGPETTTGVAHAVLFSTTAGGLPSQYLAHNSQPVSLTAGMPGNVTFDLTASTLASAAVSGTVTGPVQGQRRNQVYWRFAGENVAIALVDDYAGNDAFAYTVPTVSGTSVTLVAEAVSNSGGVAAAYAETSDPGQGPFALKLPALPTLVGPDDGKSNIDGTATFEWNTEAKVSLLCASDPNRYDYVCVVTQAKTARLPIGSEFGYRPPANTRFEWRVEVHDAYASVDAACSQAGFLSAFATESIRGPRRGSGQYAESVPRSFTTPP